MAHLKHRLWRGCRGAAMTETALLCFFIYAPIMMMVIVWGDLSLDKEDAHVAAAYMSFAPERIDDAELAQYYFPGASGAPDATMSVRQVGLLNDDNATAPGYTAVGPSAADAEMDIQAKLFAMAVGEMWGSVGTAARSPCA